MFCWGKLTYYFRSSTNKSYSIKNIVVGYLVSKLDVPQKILIVLMEI